MSNSSTDTNESYSNNLREIKGDNDLSDSDLLSKIKELEERVKERERYLSKLKLLKNNFCEETNESSLHSSINIWSSVCLRALEDLFSSLKNCEIFSSSSLDLSPREALITQLGLCSIVEVDSDNDCYIIK